MDKNPRDIQDIQELFACLLYKALQRALCQRRHALADELAAAIIRVGAVN